MNGFKIQRFVCFFLKVTLQVNNVSRNKKKLRKALAQEELTKLMLLPDT